MLGWKDVSQFNFNVVTLFEAIQIEWLITWKNNEDLCILMREYPHVSWFMKNKAPHLKVALEEIEKMHTNLVYSKELESRFINSLEDWIVYVVDPDNYDKQDHNKWESSELLDLIDFTGKTVIDVGSGTGSQTFRVANLARTVYAVEPVGNLRTFIKSKSKTLGHKNIYVIDGIMTEIPFPDNFADIVMAGHVFGDEVEDEYNELVRVIKPGGMVILIPGNNDCDNEIHEFLMTKGFDFASFLEPGDGMKRKYWKTKKVS